jgi:hypothetical protein
MERSRFSSLPYAAAPGFPWPVSAPCPIHRLNVPSITVFFDLRKLMSDVISGESTL